MVTNIIAESAPLYEKASIDEHYLYITGMDRFFGNLQWTKELRQRIIRESGLPISFGLSVNKTVSKIATEKPNHEEVNCLWPNEVRAFLKPLSIRKIPMLGKKTYEHLLRMGIAYIRIIKRDAPRDAGAFDGKEWAYVVETCQRYR